MCLCESLFHSQNLSFSFALLTLLHPRHDVVDAEDHAGGLDGGLKGLDLNIVGLPDTESAHVRKRAFFKMRWKKKKKEGEGELREAKAEREYFRSTLCHKK